MACEKRGEIEPEDLSGNLIVQLGTVTEGLNRRWYELNTGYTVKDVQRRVWHPVNQWMAATIPRCAQFMTFMDACAGSRRGYGSSLSEMLA